MYGATSFANAIKPKPVDGSSFKSEDHVWFEDRWMVASLRDEWLTTLCGLILG
jgi:hypothetical protein